MTKLKMVPVEPTREMIEAGKKEVDWYEHNAIYCYRAMLAAAPSPWISVEDDLPKAEEGSTESASVIVCLEDHVLTMGFYCHFENEWYGEDGYSFEEASMGLVTHWMPLPTLPEKSK